MSNRDEPARAAQVEHSRLAAELKAKAPAPTHPAAGDTPHEGMNSLPNEGIAPSGAFDAEGQRPVLERSRKVR